MDCHAKQVELLTTRGGGSDTLEQQYAQDFRDKYIRNQLKIYLHPSDSESNPTLKGFSFELQRYHQDSSLLTKGKHCNL